MTSLFLELLLAAILDRATRGCREDNSEQPILHVLWVISNSKIPFQES